MRKRFTLMIDTRRHMILQARIPTYPPFTPLQPLVSTISFCFQNAFCALPSLLFYCKTMYYTILFFSFTLIYVYADARRISFSYIYFSRDCHESQLVLYNTFPIISLISYFFISTHTLFNTNNERILISNRI